MCPCVRSRPMQQPKVRQTELSDTENKPAWARRASGAGRRSWTTSHCSASQHQDNFYSCADPSCCLGLRSPDGLDGGKNVRRAGLRYRHVAHMRIGRWRAAASGSVRARTARCSSPARTRACAKVTAFGWGAFGWPRSASWRMGWDSNPRTLAGWRFSRPLP